MGGRTPEQDRQFEAESRLLLGLDDALGDDDGDDLPPVEEVTEEDDGQDDDATPQDLSPVEEAVWRAFVSTCAFSDGFGGVSASGLDSFLAGPGADWEPALVRLARTAVPQLVLERRRLEAERRERRSSTPPTTP